MMLLCSMLPWLMLLPVATPMAVVGNGVVADIVNTDQSQGTSSSGGVDMAAPGVSTMEAVAPGGGGQAIQTSPQVGVTPPPAIAASDIFLSAHGNPPQTVNHAEIVGANIPGSMYTVTYGQNLGGASYSISGPEPDATIQYTVNGQPLFTDSSKGAFMILINGKPYYYGSAGAGQSGVASGGVASVSGGNLNPNMEFGSMTGLITAGARGNLNPGASSAGGAGQSGVASGGVASVSGGNLNPNMEFGSMTGLITAGARGNLNPGASSAGGAGQSGVASGGVASVSGGNLNPNMEFGSMTGLITAGARGNLNPGASSAGGAGQSGVASGGVASVSGGNRNQNMEFGSMTGLITAGARGNLNPGASSAGGAGQSGVASGGVASVSGGNLNQNMEFGSMTGLIAAGAGGNLNPGASSAGGATILLGQTGIEGQGVMVQNAPSAVEAVSGGVQTQGNLDAGGSLSVDVSGGSGQSGAGLSTVVSGPVVDPPPRPQMSNEGVPYYPDSPKPTFSVSVMSDSAVSGGGSGTTGISGPVGENPFVAQAGGSITEGSSGQTGQTSLTFNAQNDRPRPIPNFMKDVLKQPLAQLLGDALKKSASVSGGGASVGSSGTGFLGQRLQGNVAPQPVGTSVAVSGQSTGGRGNGYTGGSTSIAGGLPNVNLHYQAGAGGAMNNRMACPGPNCQPPSGSAKVTLNQQSNGGGYASMYRVNGQSAGSGGQAGGYRYAGGYTNPGSWFAYGNGQGNGQGGQGGQYNVNLAGYPYGNLQWTNVQYPYTRAYNFQYPWTGMGYPVWNYMYTGGIQKYPNSYSYRTGPAYNTQDKTTSSSGMGSLPLLMMLHEF